MQRRELFSFLSSSLKSEEKKEDSLVLRPPYYNDDDIDAFDRECQNCEATCVASCQEHVIVIMPDQTPKLDLTKGGCTYCDDCAEACKFDVLSLEHKRLIDADIVINQKKCISWQGVMCFSCKDPCFEDAIEFKAMFMPTIDLDKCTACGFCIGRCPTNAIDIKVKK